MPYKPNYLPPALGSLLLLSACATQKPELQPVAVPCPVPQVSPQLLLPAQRQAHQDLLRFAQPSTPRTSTTPTSSTP